MCVFSDSRVIYALRYIAHCNAIQPFALQCVADAALHLHSTNSEMQFMFKARRLMQPTATQRTVASCTVMHRNKARWRHNGKHYAHSCTYCTLYRHAVCRPKVRQVQQADARLPAPQKGL